MSTIRELEPGEIVTDPLGHRHCFIAQCPHPLYSSLRLVVWRSEDGTWHHDALDARQDVGPSDRADYETRMLRLRPGTRGLAGEAFDERFAVAQKETRAQ